MTIDRDADSPQMLVESSERLRDREHDEAEKGFQYDPFDWKDLVLIMMPGIIIAFAILGELD
jgi:hypothetical protein